MAEFIQKSKESVLATGNFVGLAGDEEVFGNKEFVNDITIRGDLLVSGDTRVTQIVDFTSEDGDISGHVFRGQTGYFSEIVVGSIIGSDAGASDGEASGGLNTGPVFVTNVNAVGGVESILESEFDGEVIRKVKTASNQVDVELLFERGDAQTYKPSISYLVSGDSSSEQSVPYSDMGTSSNGYSFNATLRLACPSPITYLFKNGSRLTSLILEKDTAPEVISAEFINIDGTSSMYEASSFSSFSGSATYQQTESKNGDTARVRVTVSKNPSQIRVFGGALSTHNYYGAITDNGDGTYTAEFDASVAGASNSAQAEGFSVWTKDLAGNQSGTYSSDNQIITNNASPSASLNFSYPAGQSVIDNIGQTVDVNVTATNYDEYNFSFSSALQLISSPANLASGAFVLSGENASVYTSGTMSVSLFKSSNGKTGSASSSPIWIQSYGTVPNLNLSKTVYRSSPSGETHNFSISSGEPLESLSIVSASESAVVLGTVNKNSNTSFSFSVSVDDGVPRGDFDMTFQGEKLQTEVFQSTKTGTVRGFTARSVTSLATDYLAVPIGAVVYDFNKLVVTAQPQGGNVFSIPYDSNITGPKQDGVSNLEGSFGIVNGSEILIDNQVITNAGNVLDVIINVEELL
jgi:hypothetical protein